MWSDPLICHRLISHFRSVTFSDQVEVSSPSSPTLTSTSFFTAKQSSERDGPTSAESDDSDDEFFDLPTDSYEREELVDNLQMILDRRIEARAEGDLEGVNGDHLPEGDRDLVYFERLDALLEGDRESQTLALELLKKEQRRVRIKCPCFQKNM